VDEKRVRELFIQSSALVSECAGHCAYTITRMAHELVACFDRGGKVLLFGNGGSASQAQHFAAELVNKLSQYRKPLPALALTADTATLTSIANDLSFEDVFDRQVDALGCPGDVAWALSTSGTSPNVLRAVQRSEEKEMVTLAFTGSSDSPLAQICRFVLGVPSNSTARIQEVHLCAGHALCELIEAHYCTQAEIR